MANGNREALASALEKMRAFRNGDPEVGSLLYADARWLMLTEDEVDALLDVLYETEPKE